MSDEDPKYTASVADTREEYVLPAGLIVGQATRDILDVTQAMSASNEFNNQATHDVLDITQATSATNEVNNQATSENLDAITGEDVILAGLIVAQATIDDLDATQVTSTANKVQNLSTSENTEGNTSTKAVDGVSDVTLENMQATVDSDENQLSSAAKILSMLVIIDYRQKRWGNLKHQLNHILFVLIYNLLHRVQKHRQMTRGYLQHLLKQNPDSNYCASTSCQDGQPGTFGSAIHTCKGH
jgi:hypothetical protein